ncbi:unnamed protein product [Lathyrus sativus]|nr:unnamed protein product [Lathyrus sativus]
MDMWSSVKIDELLPPLYKKGHERPKKLRFRELGEGGSRMRRVGVTYRCTKCDKIGHNSRKCKVTIQNLDALKIKMKAPRKKYGVAPVVDQGDAPNAEQGDASVVNQLDVPVADQEDAPVAQQGDVPVAEAQIYDTTAIPKEMNKLKGKKKSETC